MPLRFCVWLGWNPTPLLLRDFKEFVALPSSTTIEYLVVGGYPRWGEFVSNTAYCGTHPNGRDLMLLQKFLHWLFKSAVR